MMQTHASKQNSDHRRVSPDLAWLRGPVSTENPKESHSHHLQRTIGNQALQRLLQANAEKSGATVNRVDDSMTAQVAHAPIAKISEGSRSVMQRKCAACESGGESCAECAGDEKRAQTRLVSAESLAPDEDEREQPIAKTATRKEEQELKGSDKAVVCPTETITLRHPRCGKKYGATAYYCYSGARGWLFTERVVQGSPYTCNPRALIEQTLDTVRPRHRLPCLVDQILNKNGPPTKACTDVTTQIVSAQPTKTAGWPCEYKHDQIIEVTVDKDSKPPSGKVKTTVKGPSAEVSTECNWTS